MNKKTLIGILAFAAAFLVTLLLLRTPPETGGVNTPVPESVSAASQAPRQVTASGPVKPQVAVSPVAPPQHLAVASPVVDATAQLINTAPENVSNYVRQHGIPPLPLGTNDSYREITFVNPNGGPPTIRKAHSVEMIIDGEGKTNAFVIRYMKGQRPFTNANDGRILVGPIVNPGGDK